MFYLTSGDALAGVPKLLRKMIPGNVNKVAQGSDTIKQPCDCSADDPCASAKGALGYTFPRAIYTPDPDFSEEARKRKINGNIVTAFIVDEAGHVHNLWVTQPVGYGLDEKAAEAVLAYVFRPATRHGNPVTVPLAAEVNFQIF